MSTIKTQDILYCEVAGTDGEWLQFKPFHGSKEVIREIWDDNIFWITTEDVVDLFKWCADNSPLYIDNDVSGELLNANSWSDSVCFEYLNKLRANGYKKPRHEMSDIELIRDAEKVHVSFRISGDNIYFVNPPNRIVCVTADWYGLEDEDIQEIKERLQKVSKYGVIAIPAHSVDEVCYGIYNHRILDFLEQCYEVQNESKQAKDNTMLITNYPTKYKMSFHHNGNDEVFYLSVPCYIVHITGDKKGQYTPIYFNHPQDQCWGIKAANDSYIMLKPCKVEKIPCPWFVSKMNNEDDYELFYNDECLAEYVSDCAELVNWFLETQPVLTDEQLEVFQECEDIVHVMKLFKLMWSDANAKTVQE